MPGNSQRRGATRKRQGGNPTAGSGARRRKQLEGKGPTPKAEDRPNHREYKKKRAVEKARANQPSTPRQQSTSGRAGRSSRSSEWIAGRNAVVEALEAHVPATALHVAERAERDERLRAAYGLAVKRGLAVLEVPRSELDRLTGGAHHQGVALKVPGYEYAHPDDLIGAATDRGEVPRIVVLDKITDPRNLGAIVRSAAAFGAHGVVIPERRAATMTASAWKTSAGAAARVPVARTVNLTRQLQDYQRAGFLVCGLDAAGNRTIGDLAAELELDEQPVVVVVGAEGGGLSRLVRETCDVLVSIPTKATTESLNAGVAAGIALYVLAHPG
jgi:23S rRNA (guanosine2251-2'-O)-methyltransferase